MSWCRILKSMVVTTLLSLSSVSIAKENTLNDILSLTEAPEGVVIEIVTGDTTGLDWALPQSQDYIKQIRQRFKDLPISIVTHGNEQFALTKSNQAASKNEHKTVRSLIKDSKIPLHVCGTFAGWRGLSDEDFPDYVDVAASGPAQINDYIAVGYLLLVIRSDNAVFD